MHTHPREAVLKALQPEMLCNERVSFKGDEMRGRKNKPQNQPAKQNLRKVAASANYFITSTHHLSQWNYSFDVVAKFTRGKVGKMHF